MNSWATLDLPPLATGISFPQLSLFNSESRKVEKLPVQDIYRLYVCGITPYDATHLGHAATYLTFDLINRYLRATGSRVRYVQNITDIDDPLLERAKRDNVDWKDLAQSQIDLFRGDMVDLHVLPPDHYIGAVEAIPLVVEAIKKLQSHGTVYQVDSDLYFVSGSDSAFGSRSHLTSEEQLKIFSERGGDPDRAGKKNPLDCLVWMSRREGEPGWQSDLGEGRPGWHIECSAIALHYLEPDPSAQFSIDIQGGGSDLLFPHHDMGAAQGQVLASKPFARTYVHAGMIGLDGEKMSKSKGNLVFVSKLIQSGHNPIAIRIALMAHPYGNDHMWSSADLEKGEKLLSDLQTALSRTDVAPTQQLIQEIVIALSNNLDTPKVLTLLENWIKQTLAGATGGSAGELSRSLDRILGIAL